MFIWDLLGRPPAKHIDHIDGQPLNNAEDNLRAATASQNVANRRNGTRHNTSGVSGVSWDKRRECWRAYVSFERRQILLGRFDSKEDAQHARDLAVLKYYKDFAVLNPPTDPMLTQDEYRAILSCTLP